MHTVHSQRGVTMKELSLDLLNAHDVCTKEGVAMWKLSET